jgi:hypothetical protein
MCYVGESRPSLWSSGQSSWQQIQTSGFDDQRYQIFWEVVGLERGPLSLVSTIEELLEKKKVAAAVKKPEITAVGNPPRWPSDTTLSAKDGTNFDDKRQSLGRYSSFGGLNPRSCY